MTAAGPSSETTDTEAVSRPSGNAPFWRTGEQICWHYRRRTCGERTQPLAGGWRPIPLALSQYQPLLAWNESALHGLPYRSWM